jgi:hypothetical protein
MSKFNKLVAKILNESVNMDEIIQNVLNDMEHGDEQLQEVLDGCSADYGVDGKDVAQAMLDRAEEFDLDDDVKEMLSDYIGGDFTHEFSFGYDTDNIAKVQNYIKNPKNNYVKDVDYKMYTGIGDDHMNFLKINLKEGDSELMELIQKCHGKGKVRDNEEFEDDYDEY